MKHRFSNGERKKKKLKQGEKGGHAATPLLHMCVGGVGSRTTSLFC
jgi:hypothetical protein